MANIGDQLLQPDNGMQRIDDSNLNIIYNGTFTQKSDTNKHNDTSIYTTTLNDSIEFYFYGTKFYIIDMYYKTRSNQIMVEIDGSVDGTWNGYNATATTQLLLVYKKEGLKREIHHVKITNKSSSSNTTMLLDCIDIDEDGYMCYQDDNGKLYYDVTPIMTSNNTPSPYVASASSEYDNYLAYKAFNEKIGIEGWASNNKQDSITLNFGKKIKINALKMTCGNTDGWTQCMPYEFKILGSNSDSSYNLISEYNNLNSWGISESKLFNINNVENYQYYKIDCKTNGIHINMSELRYLLAVETPFYLIQDNINNKTYNYDEENTSLVEVTDTSIVKEDVLNNTCISNLNNTLPLLDTLSDDLTILCNNDRKLIAKGIKSNLELITSKQILSVNIAHLIRELEVVCALVGNGSIKVIVSRDKGTTWSYWDTTTNTWLNLANTVTKRDYNSMTDGEKEKWEALKQEAWQYGMTPDIVKIADFESIKDNGFKFAFVLSRPTYEDNAVLKELDWTYDEDGGYIVLNNTDILIKKTDKYIKLVPQRNMENIKVEIVN